MSRSYRKFYKRNPYTQRDYEKKGHRAIRRIVSHLLKLKGEEIEILLEKPIEKVDPWCTPRNQSSKRKYLKERDLTELRNILSGMKFSEEFIEKRIKAYKHYKKKYSRK